jgi:light-harvesting complex I chlorophyll a/b binding protein 1
LAKYQENELINGRYAMLGVAGILAVELFGQGNWVDAPKWAITGGTPTYFGVELPFNDIGLITVIELVLMAGVEVLRSSE